jgi:hypothetical protein
MTSDSRWLISSWLAPARSTRTSSLDRKRAGIWRIAAVSTVRWPVKVSGAGVARPQQHRQALGGIGQPGGQGVEAFSELPAVPVTCWNLVLQVWLACSSANSAVVGWARRLPASRR